MPARLTLDGVTELRAQLRQLPHDLADDGVQIALTTAYELRTEVMNAYPRGPTGNLLRKVVVENKSQALSANVRVRNRAAHAYLFEHGTQARHTKAGLNRGRMPPGRVFIPRAVAARRRLWRRLTALLQQHGLRVTGHAE